MTFLVNTMELLVLHGAKLFVKKEVTTTKNLSMNGVKLMLKLDN